MMRSPLFSLLLLALLMRGMIAPGAMLESRDGQLTFAMCGPSGGVVTLDLGAPVAADHGAEAERCLYAGVGAGLPVADASLTLHGSIVTEQKADVRPVAPLRQADPYQARGPPPRL